MLGLSLNGKFEPLNYYYSILLDRELVSPNTP